MTNWLKPYGKLPAIRTAATPVAKQDFNAKLAAFKQAHGFRERHTMLCHCSRFGRAFEVVFERASDTERFAVCSVNKLSEHAGGGGSRAPQSKRFDMRQFDTTRWHCPWCSAQSWVHCPCGRNNCDSRFKQRGGTLYTCEPGCGASGNVMPLTEIAASAASNAPAFAKGSTASALPGAGRTSLPKPNLPRLTGK